MTVLIDRRDVVDGKLRACRFFFECELRGERAAGLRRVA